MRGAIWILALGAVGFVLFGWLIELGQRHEGAHLNEIVAVLIIYVVASICDGIGRAHRDMKADKRQARLDE